MTVNYKQAVDQALAARNATIPADFRLPKSSLPLPKNVSGLVESSGLLDTTEIAIVNLSATNLRDAIAAQKYTSVAVAQAYAKAAAVAHQGTNCLVELFTEEALERAQWLDDQLQKTGTVVGPLHGVPVSIKVSFRSLFLANEPGPH